MNKWEKEVQQSLLNDEQQVLNVLKMAYAGTLRDVQDKMSAYFARIQANPNDVSAIYQFRYQQALQDQIYNILDNLKNQNYQTISEYLEHSYENGWLGAMYDIHRQGIPVIMPINQENAVRAITINSRISVPMYTRLGTDINLLRVAIAGEVTRGITSGSAWHDVSARISDKANISAYNAMRIARTEGHRVQCNAQYDACNSAKQSGADVVNQWDSTMDSRTRDTHRRLHKQLREVGQPFEIDGKKALYPGAFGIPEEDIHCRCALLQRARWALSEAELQQLRNTPEAKALAETSDFEEFKSKYLEITEKLPYSGEKSLTKPLESGTIELPPNRDQLDHIFGDRKGHVPATEENKKMMLDVANDVRNFRGIDKHGNAWHIKLSDEGKQIWVRSQNGTINECGVNDVPREWDDESGLNNNPFKHGKGRKGKKKK